MKKLASVVAALLLCSLLASTALATRVSSPTVEGEAEIIDVSAPLESVSATEIAAELAFDASLDPELLTLLEEFVLVLTDIALVEEDGTLDEDASLLSLEGTTKDGLDGTLYVYQEGLQTTLTQTAEEFVTAGLVVASFDLSLEDISSGQIASLPEGTSIQLEIDLPTDRTYVVLHDLGVVSTQETDGVTTSVITYDGTNLEMIAATYTDGILTFVVDSASPFTIVASALSFSVASPDTGISLSDTERIETILATQAESTASNRQQAILLCAGVLALTAFFIGRKAMKTNH